MSKLQKFVDGYCLFIDYGVIGWGAYAFITIVSTILAGLGFISHTVAITTMFLGMMVMVGFWYWGYTLRRVPEFWLDLAKGKNFQQ